MKNEMSPQELAELRKSIISAMDESGVFEISANNKKYDTHNLTDTVQLFHRIFKPHEPKTILFDSASDKALFKANKDLAIDICDIFKSNAKHSLICCDKQFAKDLELIYNFVDTELQKSAKENNVAGARVTKKTRQLKCTLRHNTKLNIPLTTYYIGADSNDSEPDYTIDVITFNNIEDYCDYLGYTLTDESKAPQFDNVFVLNAHLAEDPEELLDEQLTTIIDFVPNKWPLAVITYQSR